MKQSELEKAARSQNRVDAPTPLKKRAKEHELGADLRLKSEFVDNLLSDGEAGGKTFITPAMVLEAAENIQVTGEEIDQATFSPPALVGKYHAYKINSSFPIPGAAIVDDYRRRFLSMYAAEQEKALVAPRAEHELTSEVRVAVLDRLEEVRLPSTIERLLTQLEKTVAEKDDAVRANDSKDTTFPASEEGMHVFDLLRARKVTELEDLFARGEINVRAVEPGSSATGLHRATTLGLLTIVKLYLKGGADANHETPTGTTPLHTAWDSWLKLKDDHPQKRTRFLIARDLVQLLLEYGADPNHATSHGLTPLHMAAMYGHDDIIAILLRHGANRGMRDKQGRTPLDVAVGHGNRGAAGLLRNWGAVEHAYKAEEFRKEWDAVLEEKARRARHQVKASKHSPTKNGGPIVRLKEQSAYDAARAEEKASDALFTAGGGQSAEELIKGLELQETLRVRRKRLEQEAANTVARERPHIPVAEYDLERDALRAINEAEEYEAAGEHSKATQVRLAATRMDVTTLPWGQRAKAANRDENDQLVEEEGVDSDDDTGGEGGDGGFEDDGDGRASSRGGDGGSRNGSTRNLAASVYSASAHGIGSSRGDALRAAAEEQAAKGDSNKAYDELDDHKPKMEGPSMDVSAENNTIAAQKRKELRIKWQKDTSNMLALREKKAAQAKQRSADGSQDITNLAHMYTQHKDAARKRRASMVASAAEASKQHTLSPAEAALAAADGTLPAPPATADGGTTVATTATPSRPTTQDIEQFMSEEQEEALRAAEEKERLLMYYRGRKQEAKTDGHELERRRKKLAATIGTDAADNLRDYTRVYNDMVVTRKPATLSAILRPSRFRVDTRRTVDADHILRDGRAFAQLMLGQGGEAMQLPVAGAVTVTDVKGTRANGDAVSLSEAAVPSLGERGSVAGALGMTRQEVEQEAAARAALRQSMSGMGNTAAKRQAFGTMAANEAALLPASSAKRATAQVTAAAAGKANTELVQDAEATTTGALNDKTEVEKLRIARVRRMMLDARAELEAEVGAANRVQQAALKDDAAQKTVKVKSIEEIKKEKAEKAAAAAAAASGGAGGGAGGHPKPPEPKIGEYGLGLLPQWPLHQPGPLLRPPGYSYKDLSMVDVMASEQRIFQDQLQKQMAVFERYRTARMKRATAIAKGQAGGGAGGPGGPVKLELPQVSGGSLHGMLAAAAAQAKSWAPPPEPVLRLGGVPDSAVPVLTASAKEVQEFLHREPPKRLLPIPEPEEMDLRASRNKRFDVFTGMEDPWKGVPFDIRAPESRQRM